MSMRGWDSTLGFGERPADDLQVLYRMQPHVCSSITSLPAPRRSGCTDREPAPPEQDLIRVGGVERGHLISEVGQVPFEGAKLDGLEVDEHGVTSHDEDVQFVRGAVEHTSGTVRCRPGGDALEQSLTQKRAVGRGHSPADLGIVEEVHR